MEKITSRNSIRPELTSIYFAPDKMVATDSYRLIEVKKEIGIPEPRILKAKGFKGRGAVTVTADNIVNDGGKLIQGEHIDANYPDYQQIFDGLNDEPRFSMLSSAKLLSELLAEVDAQANDPFHKVRLDFFDKMKPLVITASGNTGDKAMPQPVAVRAMLSPMTG